MILKSPGRRTDLIFARFSGLVIERDDYIVIKTPSNPGYHWGNYLIFERAPREADFTNWPAIYRREFADYDSIRHMTFTWDEEVVGGIEPFVQAGFRFETGVFLEARAVRPPPKFNSTLEVRPLGSESEWEDAIALQSESRSPDFAFEPYLKFKREQFASYRAMADAGRGARFGAFQQGELVGELGIFYEGKIGRYQNVVTRESRRRQGIGGTLVYEAARIAFRDFAVDALVMEADASYHAARIYESVGFQPTERNFSLSWWEQGT